MDSLDLNKDTQPEMENVEQGTETSLNAVTETSPHTIEEAKTVEKNPYANQSKADLTAALQHTIEQQVDEIKEKVENIKQAFYKIYNAEQETQKQTFIDAGGEIADYKATTDEEELHFKQLLAEYKKRKAAENTRKEQEKEQNLLRKQHILAQMKSLVESSTDVSGNLQEFKQLQQSWKEVGAIPATASTNLWKQYNLYQEQFYDLVKINNELREYDFKKNLEAKTALCVAAEKLHEQTDIVVAFHELQKLHDEWKGIGPVARELREEIWTRFQHASVVINKKHQDFFQALHAQEEENLQKKNALCEQLEAIDTTPLSNFKAWEEKSAEVIEIQSEWRKIGFAPRKANQQIYERYRGLCDKFFEQKATFYKQTKNDLAANLEKKRSLCEQAEALKDSSDWKETTDKLVKLQKEWKATGTVSKKYSDEVWKRFIAACDYFFEQKKINVPDQKAIEQQNLAQKKAIIEKIETFEKLSTEKETIAAIRTLSNEFNAIGFVPYKEKDKIYKEFKAAVDKQFESLNIDKAHRRIDHFRNNLEDMQSKGESKLLDERRKLMRVYENLKAEIGTCENNIGFFSAKSKKSEGLLKEMERKITSLKEELQLIEKKINLIEEKL